MSERFIRKPQVLKDTGLSHTTLYRLIKNSKFPAPIHVSDRIAVWQESLVQQWISDRIQAAAPKEIGGAK